MKNSTIHEKNLRFYTQMSLMERLNVWLKITMETRDFRSGIVIGYQGPIVRLGSHTSQLNCKSGQQQHENLKIFQSFWSNSKYHAITWKLGKFTSSYLALWLAKFQVRKSLCKQWRQWEGALCFKGETSTELGETRNVALLHTSIMEEWVSIPRTIIS